MAQAALIPAACRSSACTEHDQHAGSLAQQRCWQRDSAHVQGLCIALLFIAGVGFMVDGFAERRTHPYTETLPAAAQMPMTDHER